MKITRRPARPLLTAFISLALFGCGSSGSDTSTNTANPATPANNNPAASLIAPISSAAPGGTASATSSDALKGLGCGWIAASDADTANIAFPDKAARYWVALVPMTPGNRLRIDGVYPAAR